jgi:hypothetical protein
MLIGGITFTLASSVRVATSDDGQPVLQQPAARFSNPRGLRLHRYGQGPFGQLLLDPLPREPGVYAVVDALGEIRYIGRARDSIAKRWGPAGYRTIHPRNCFEGGQQTNCRINALIVSLV